MSSELYLIDKSPPSLREEVIQYGLKKAQKPAMQSFVLAIFAGAFIALAFVFYITVTTGGHSAWGTSRLVGGLAFSLGLMLVVICGAELFTSTVLNSVAWAHKKISTLAMLRCWGRVFIGNFCGAILTLALILMAQMHQLDGGQWGENAIHIAQHKLHHNWLQAFALGVLCNLLVCLGVWMSLSSKDALGKTLLLVLPVAMFVSSGFEHSIANLFMVPLGISLRYLAEAGLYQLPSLTLSELSDLTFTQFIFHNLIPVALGNIAGGALLIALGKEFIREPIPTPCQTTSLITGDIHMTKSTIANKSVKDLTLQQPVIFSMDTSFTHALEELVARKVKCAVVMSATNELVGIISEQDLLRQLWAEEFAIPREMTVRQVMQTEVLTVSPDDKIDALIEYMTVDRTKLFPVNQSGSYLGGAYHSFEERLKRASAQMPSHYPVLKGGQLQGMLCRSDLLAYVHQEQAPQLEELTEKIA